ncbi:uncharacterized protein YoxC [Aminobacter niigataensis]|uniref:Uncharacterized protein YoxC n=1 Tax=Aminobacter niigataensis TaxID=83265 RepID=A0ABR6L3L1_9HYPH|nr:hypothetical protein [Aminobacter niigataensis]MBB4650625.1 uncharacterized protein YoxC [Aminobacter niigataensis]
MSDYEKWLRRVRERADALREHMGHATNAPIDDHIDRSTLEGLIDTFSVSPDSATQEDVARIYIVREGFRALLDRVHDLDEFAEFSVRQLSGALDSLYVEADALLRSRDEFVQGAGRLVDHQKMSNRLPISAGGSIGQTLVKASEEVISSAVISRNAIAMTILHSNQVDALNELKVSIQRLSATAFAIKVLLNSSVVYDATIKFLNEGADRVLTDIKEIAAALQETFASKQDLEKAVGEVVNSGTRFVKLVGRLISNGLENDAGHREVVLTLRNAYKTRTLLSSVAAQTGLWLGGRGGVGVTVQASGQLQAERIDVGADILSAAFLKDGRLAFGTNEGLMVWAPRSKSIPLKRSLMSDNFVAICVQEYQHNETIVAASRDGRLRRYWMPAGDLQQLREERTVQSDIRDKVGQRIKAIFDYRDRLVVAVDNRLTVLHKSFEMDWEVSFPQQVQAACVLNSGHIVVVGKGMVALVNFVDGQFTQGHGVPDQAEYVAVCRLSDSLIAVANSHGKVRAIDISNGGELGELSLDFEVRGLAAVGKLLVAYGGNWHREGKALAIVLWDDKLDGNIVAA